MKKILILTILSVMMIILVAPFGANEIEVNTNINNNSTIKLIELNAGISKIFYESSEFNIEKLSEIISFNGWTTKDTNIMKEPNKNSEVTELISFNTYIEYYYENEEWAKVRYNEIEGYISTDCIIDFSYDYIEYNLPKNKGFKSYLPYNLITNQSSKQYKLQNYAYTGNNGIRQVDNRYCIAIGTAFNTEIGDYVDLVLENGEIIHCVVSDIKADIHTDKNNIMTISNGCVSEFLVDLSVLDKKVKIGGDISLCNDSWNSSVVTLRVYDKNIFIN